MGSSKFPMLVSDGGIHICVDDILTPLEAFELIKEIRKSISEYKKLMIKESKRGLK